MEQRVSVPAPEQEVLVVDPEEVKKMKALRARGWGFKRLAREFGFSKNTVKRYVRGGEEALEQVRPKARCLTAEEQQRAEQLLATTAEGNAVVVHELLEQEGVQASLRTVQRAVKQRRQERRAAELATVRFETEPGHQLQLDFGQKLVRLGEQWVRIFILVAVLGYSRRLFVKTFLGEKQADWLEGIAAAFVHFGGVPLTLLVDNASPLVDSHNRQTRVVRFNPGFLAFCKDWDVTPKACYPTRARTKGKCENTVKYVKHNGLAGREFDSKLLLDSHLADWRDRVDRRVHGTTHEVPLERFERTEKQALRPLPGRPALHKERRLQRKVANDCLVNVDTVRYSVPHRLVKEQVEVLVGPEQVRILFGGQVVATHRRSLEPHRTVKDPAHYQGLWRATTAPEPAAKSPLARDLAEYQKLLTGEGA